MLTKLIRGSPIIIDCPACGATDIEFKTFSRFNGTLHLVMPFIELTPYAELTYTRFVVCSLCDIEFLTTLTLQQLTEVSPGTVLRTLYRPDDRAASALAICAIVFAVIPGAGLLLSLVFLLFLQRRVDWRSIICWLSIPANVGFTMAWYYWF